MMLHYPATAADVPLTLGILRGFLGAQSKEMVANAVVQTMPVLSTKRTKRVMIDKLVEYVGRGGHDKTVRYSKAIQGFTKRCLADWLAPRRGAPSGTHLVL